MSLRRFLVQLFLMNALLGAALVLSGCVLMTVRTLDEDKLAKEGFSGQKYVDTIWESRVLPTYREKAQDLSTLLGLIAQNRQAAIDQFGSRSGTGAYSFMVRGEGTILALDTSSRTGLITIDLAPEDGMADLNLVIGPLIKISQRAAVRDAVGFIQYGSFVNQQEFAEVANAMGSRIVAMIINALGVDDEDAIRELPPAAIEGKRVSFIGAFMLEDLANVVVVPIDLEVID